MVIERLRNTSSKVPVDLRTVIALVVAINLSLLVPAGARSPLRLVFELVLVVFLPGYAVVAALFPEAGRRLQSRAGKADDIWRDEGITTVERVAFSFALSVAIVPLIGLVLNFTPWGLRRIPLVVGVSGFVAIATVVATIRRLSVPEMDRFEVDIDGRFQAFHAMLFDGDRSIDRVLTVCLMVGVVLAVVSVGYVVSVPAHGERTTEFYALTEDDDGELVMDDFPQSFDRGESRPIVLRVRNLEYRTTEYAVVVELQKVSRTTDSTAVVEERELDRLETTSLDQNETWTKTHRITPTMTGDRLRLVYLLFQGPVPDDPTVDNAYRTLQFDVNVSTAGNAATTD